MGKDLYDDESVVCAPDLRNSWVLSHLSKGRPGRRPRGSTWKGLDRQEAHSPPSKRFLLPLQPRCRTQGPGLTRKPAGRVFVIPCQFP